MAYVIKAEMVDADGETFVFAAQKTMYGGRRIAAGDTVYLFDSENEGGAGLMAKGVVTAAAPVPPRPDLERQTPRVSVTVRRTATATRPLGRRELKPFGDWNDGRPQTELNFKFYRQATNKIAAVGEATAAFLETFF